MITIKLKKEYFTLLLLLTFTFLIFRFPHSVKNGVTEGMTLCFLTIIPSLFPFMVLSSYISNSDILFFTYKIFSPVMKFLFHLPACVSPVILFSSIGGFPIGIKMTSELYKKGQITQNQAERMCLFCMNAGPSFVISAVGSGMLKSIKAGIIIYSALCISSLIIGIVSRFFYKNESTAQQLRVFRSTKASLTHSVTTAVNSTLNICAWVILFNAFISCVHSLKIKNLPFLFFTSIFEVTKACKLSVGVMPLQYLAMIMGFGGICVHCQVLSFLKECNVKYIHFLLSRILSGLISAVITHILLWFFPVEIDVFSEISNTQTLVFSASIPTFLVVTAMCIIMIFDIDRDKKVW